MQSNNERIKPSTKDKGNAYEDECVKFLIDNNITKIRRNYSCRMGEVDIIGYDGDTLVFFEVKYRKNGTSGFAAEAVDFRKQKKISMVAANYLMVNKLTLDTSVRFDVLAVDGINIKWYKNAFEYCL